MFQSTDKNGVVTIDNNRLAEIRQVPNPDAPNPPPTVDKYYKLGSVFSCDEWPAARYVSVSALNIVQSQLRIETSWPA